MYMYMYQVLIFLIGNVTVFFDFHSLDIKPNIVAMGFPSEKVEGFFRNNLQDVVKYVH